MKRLLFCLGIMLPLHGFAEGLIFQKVAAAVNLSGADITEARLIENESGHAVRISFSEAGRTKLAAILDEGDTQINLVMGNRILLTAPLPRPMTPPEYFTISVPSSAEANELLEFLSQP